MITAACENPELAQRAIDFMCSAEAQEIYANAQMGVYLNENTNLDVLPALADKCGFTDYIYFLKSFKKKFRCSPKEYKAGINKNEF